MDNKSYTSTEEFPFPAMEPDKDEMFINIRNRNYATFKKEIVTLEQKTKDFFISFTNVSKFILFLCLFLHSNQKIKRVLSMSK